MLEIIKAPNLLLSQKTKNVDKVNKSILTLLDDMTKSLEAASDPVGVGLAAPQVGKGLKIFIVKPSLKSKIFVFINPKIIKTSVKEKIQKSKVKKLEGCLSLPNIWGEVTRYHEVYLEYLDKEGKKHNRRFTGFIATVIQHEMDHLEGILFTKRVLEQKGTLYKSEKDEKGQDVFEQLKI